VAISLNGTNQGLYANSAVGSHAPLAISGWYKTPSAHTGVIASQGRLATAGAPQYGVAQISSVQSAQAVSRVNTSGTASSSASYSLDVWQHIFAVFYSATDRKVWLNGGNIGTDTTNRSPSVGSTEIGFTRYTVSGVTSSVNFFAGKLAEVAMWTGATAAVMGATEAASLAAARPIDIGVTPTFYQPLVGAANESGSIGLTMTELSSPSYDAADHPFYSFNPAWARGSNIVIRT
jgi:hypothetical protein